MMESPNKRERRYAGGNTIFYCLFAVLLPCLVAAESSSEKQIEEIVARSYASHTLRSILGRSASHRVEGKGSWGPRARRVSWGLDDYEPLIKRYSAVYGLDADLLRAVIYAESKGDRRAVSSKGAVGLMQLMPDTAAELGVEDPFDPEQNIASGARYLRSLLDRFGSVELALWAYNAGPRAVEENRLPFETRNYVPRVLRLRRMFRAHSGE